MARTQTLARAHALARAVAEAQRLANADEYPYVVARGAGRERPWVTHLPGLELASEAIIEGAANGSILLVVPQGEHHGRTVTEIVDAELPSAAFWRARHRDDRSGFDVPTDQA